MLGDAFFKTLALKQYFSRVADSVWQPDINYTVQVSADVPVKVVVNCPTISHDPMANTLASSKARIFGHDYGLERSSKKNTIAI